MSNPLIIDVYPANEAEGIVLGDKITVLFDQEMDENSIDSGTFVLVGPTKDFLFGRDFTPLDVPGIEDEQILNSPYTTAYVEGIYSFERVAISSLSIVDTLDTIGSRTLYRTKVTFTPSRPLAPGVLYTVLLAGDENITDDYDSGVKSRSVFDTISSVSGNGSVTFNGSYIGTTTTTYHVEITAGGQCGNAEYIWWDENDPLTTFPGITTTGRRQIDNGVWITCDPDSTFVIGDTFSVVCVTPELLEDNYRWSFTTGSGSILTPPSSSSASGIADISSSSTSISVTFGVSSVSPVLRAYNLNTSLTEINITFNETPDVLTIIDDNFSIFTEPVNGDSEITANGELTFTPSLSGNIVTLTLDPNQLLVNNIVKITISDNVKNTDGDSLVEYSWFFTTTYTPMYSSVRRIRLDLGALIASIPNETIMLALFEASRYVDSVSFVSSINNNSSYYNMARRELTTCYAEAILVRTREIDNSGDLRKTLGDLSVGRGGGSGFGNLGDKLENCMAKWEVVVQTGGEIASGTSLKPGYTVKGATAEDRIGVGREWEPTSFPGSQEPIGNYYQQATARRWVKKYRKRNN
jgi:hypothetical protein